MHIRVLAGLAVVGITLAFVFLWLVDFDSPWAWMGLWALTMVTLSVVLASTQRVVVLLARHIDGRLDRHDRQVQQQVQTGIDELSRQLQEAQRASGHAVQALDRAMQDRDARLGAKVDQIGVQVDQAATSTTQHLTRLQVNHAAIDRRTFHQFEALSNLYALLDVRGAMPPSRGWALSPDILLQYVELIRTRRPGLIVECGSGTSTVWAALTLRTFDIPGRVVALDHDAAFADVTRDHLARNGLDDLATIRTAPLEDQEADGGTHKWYAAQAWHDLDDIDLLMVDGPPADTGPMSRLPALFLLHDHLATNTLVLLDDTVRQDEKDVVRRWHEAYPTFSIEHVDVEKGAAILTR